MRASGVVFATVALCFVAVCVSGIRGAEDPFKAWIREMKIDISKLNRAEFIGFGLGAEAVEDIKVDDEIARVPISVFLSSKTGRDSIFPKLVEKYPDVNDQLVLALMLLREKYSASSPYRPWIESLPKSFSTPLYFSESEMNELKGSSLFALSKTRLEQLQKTHTIIQSFMAANYSDVFGEDTLSFDDFKWAISVVASRSFTLNLVDGTIVALIPGIDMINHGSVETEFRFDNDTSSFIATTKTAFEKGDQVFINTGRKSNLDLLLSNGYVHDNDNFDVVLLSTKTSENDDDMGIKHSILDKKKIPREGFYFLTRKEISPNLLTALRVQLGKGSDLLALSKQNETEPVSLENELSVYRTLLAACESMFRDYDTTVEDDAKKLKRNLSANVRSAIRLRKGEKEVLQAAVNNILSAWRDILLYGFPPKKPSDSPSAASTPKSEETATTSSD